ncbi:DoxX family protein [Nitrosomonas communis]|uniref:Putative oxidoreductase n=1 Tax=Nitrosomonas communis TaxID=44574 RepID=A0A1I4SPG3_9PROT|nr:DoxX family protein [Nitrosomonas communis]SFM66183.1 putative oxidoreductase [Nitrosomonas communis]
MFQVIHGTVTRFLTQATIANVLFLLARVLLASIFVMAGYNKLGVGYEGTAQYMTSMGVSPLLLPLTIALELGGGIALILGWQTRTIALLLVGFSVVTGIIFHGDSAEQIQQIMLMKNISMAGGLLVLALAGAGRLSLDRKLYGDSV